MIFQIRRKALVTIFVAGVTSFGIGHAIRAQAASANVSTAEVAGQHPPLTSMRDVEVLYRVQPKKFPNSLGVTVMFKAGGNFLRVDGPRHVASTVFDRKNHLVTLILHEQKLYNRFSPKSGLRNPFMLDLGMKYTRDGEDKVAGEACTKWAIKSRYGTATACVTDDGVILREEGVDADGVSGSLVAVKVYYHDLPQSDFDVPVGYTPMSVRGVSKQK